MIIVFGFLSLSDKRQDEGGILTLIISDSNCFFKFVKIIKGFRSTSPLKRKSQDEGGILTFTIYILPKLSDLSSGFSIREVLIIFDRAGALQSISFGSSPPSLIEVNLISNLFNLLSASSYLF